MRVSAGATAFGLLLAAMLQAACGNNSTSTAGRPELARDGVGDPPVEPQLEPREPLPLSRLPGDFTDGKDMAQPVEIYVYSDGFVNERILLGADGTYRRTWSGCVSATMHEGRFTRDGASIELQPPTSVLREIADKLAMQLRVVDWGERRYLVPDMDSAWQMFCNDVNAGELPTDKQMPNFFLTRLGDEGKPVAVRPEVPGAWVPFLFDAPITGHTTNDPDDGVWVDLGSEDGVCRGQQLWVNGIMTGSGKTVCNSVEVLSVEPHRSCIAARTSRQASMPSGLVVTSRRPKE